MGNGHIVGFFHEMFNVDGDRAHPVFSEGTKGNIQIMYAGGDDLQERKKLLVTGADAVVVLPGGPGTWDELWEMACARNVGFTSLPIVCVNVDGYYESFRSMLERAYSDKLIHHPPDYLVHFEPNSQLAVKWIEEQAMKSGGYVSKAIASAVKMTSETKKSVLPILHG